MSKLQIIDKNVSLLNSYKEVVFGKYDDSEMTNFACSSPKFPGIIFIISESNSDNHLTEFVKNNITSQQSGIEQLMGIKLPIKLSDKDIEFDSGTFTLNVLKINIENNKLDIKSLSLLEWYLSLLLFDVENNLDLVEILTGKIFNLYSLNFTDITDNYKELLEDNNFKEIMENEKIF